MKRQNAFLATALVMMPFISPGGIMAKPIDSGQVEIRTTLDRPVLIRDGNEDQRVVIKIDVTGRGGLALKRNPVNLALVLDRSGSMSGKKLEQAKQAAHMLVDQLGEEDTFSLVIYDTEVEVIVPAQKLRDSRREIQRKISRIQPGGSTALYDGVRTGALQLREYISSRRINRVMLLSDGIANVGPSSNREIANLGRKLASDDISVTTVGLGDDYNEDLMTALAEASDANYYYVADVEELPSVFQEELGELKSLIAREIVIRVECPEGVRPIRILGRPGEIKGQTEEVRFQTLASEQTRELFLECVVSSDFVGDKTEIADVSLEYADATTGAQNSAGNRKIVVGYSADRDVVEKSINRSVEAEATVYANAVETEKAIALADKGDVAACRIQLQTQAVKLREALSIAPAPQRAAIELEIDAVEEAESGLDAAGGFSKSQRKVLQNRAYELRNSK